MRFRKNKKNHLPIHLELRKRCLCASRHDAGIVILSLLFIVILSEALAKRRSHNIVILGQDNSLEPR